MHLRLELGPFLIEFSITWPLVEGGEDYTDYSTTYPLGFQAEGLDYDEEEADGRSVLGKGRSRRLLAVDRKAKT